MKFDQYARERLEQALNALQADESDEALTAAQLGLMALHLHFQCTGTITLVPMDVIEHIEPPAPMCTCPPDLLVRGGYRGGCPAHNRPRYA